MDATRQHPSAVAATHPDRAALIVGDTVVTYGELDARSNQVAHLLAELGLTAGDHVALMLENRPEFFDIAWGALRSGLYVTPINWHLNAEEAAYIAADCDARVLIASAELGATVADVVSPATQCLSIGGRVPGWADADVMRHVQPNARRDDESEGAWMLYSSGTTGKPKGIKPGAVGQPIGTPNLFVALLGGLYGVTEDSVYLSPAPLYHAAPAGWTNAVQRLGGTVVAMERFDPLEALALIERHRVTHVQFVPTHLVRLLRLSEEERAGFDLSSLQMVVHAGAPCPPDVKRAAIEWLGPVVHEYYAGSEGVGFSAIGPQEWLDHPGSVGKSLLGAVHIVDDAGVEVAAGEAGEVWFESASQFEYHRDPAKTSAAINDRGWATLGDVGWLDADGYLYLTDRVSNMVISGGVNIYPREIEDVLIGHPAVEDVAVVGIADADLGEEVRAVVQLRVPGTSSDALAAELIEYSRARLSHFKCPRSVAFVDEVPRLPSGKLAKRLLPKAAFER